MVVNSPAKQRHRRMGSPQYTSSSEESDCERVEEETAKHRSRTNRYRDRLALQSLIACRSLGITRKTWIRRFLIISGTLVLFVLCYKELSTGLQFSSEDEGHYQFNAVSAWYFFTSPSRFESKPRMVQVQKDFTVHAMPLSWEIKPLVSRKVEYRRPEDSWIKPKQELEDGCESMADWQTALHLSCNSFHEWDPSYIFDSQDRPLLEMVNNGAYRDVWMIREYNGTQRAIKTLRFSKKREFDQRNMDRHRRDAVAYEVLAGSTHIANMYGYCVNSAFFDYSDGGDLEDLISSGRKLSDAERLKIAYSTAAALADAHHVDSKGRATIAHTDVKPNQFILLDGEYKMNDFNRNRLLAWNPETKEQCGFKVAKNRGMWRAPEEYRYDFENEKVDVWSLGLVLYFILTGEYPYQNQVSDFDDVPKFVRDGGRPRVEDASILSSTHPFHRTMIQAIDACTIHDPKRRASAREVADMLYRAKVSLPSQNGQQ